MKRLIVTGTRHGIFDGRVSAGLYAAYRVLEPEPSLEPVILVHGAAKGIDTQAKQIWEERMVGPVEPHPARWREFGKGAGPIRNQEMVDLGADLCIAFPDDDSIGTWDCVKRARRADITVLIIGDYEEPK